MSADRAKGADFFKTDSCKIGAETIGAAVSNTGMPVELDSGVKMVGMGHKLSPQEANAGVSVFGGGSIFNPQAGGNLPGTQISIADATSLVKGGLTQDLANAGLSRVMGSKGLLPNRYRLHHTQLGNTNGNRCCNQLT